LFGRGLPPINFTRPELSPCLQAFDSPVNKGYAQALALIKTGSDMLIKHPRADMLGFKACKEDQKRLDFYQTRKKIETHNREALLSGKKLYD